MYYWGSEQRDVWKFKGCWKQTWSQGQGVQINISPSRQLRAESNVCIHTVLHECILTICTSHAALSETRAGHCLCSHCSFKSQSSYWVNLDIKTKYTDDPKPLSSTSFRQLQVALLQDFSAWVSKAALLQFHNAAGKIHPENKSLLIWNGFPVYCDNFFCLILVQLVVQSLLFEYSVRSCIFCGCNQVEHQSAAQYVIDTQKLSGFLFLSMIAQSSPLYIRLMGLVVWKDMSRLKLKW